VTIDPLIPSHREAFSAASSRSVTFDDGVLLVSYVSSDEERGGVYIHAPGKPPVTVAVTNPTNARKVGDFLLVGANNLGIPDAPFELVPPSVWRMRMDNLVNGAATQVVHAVEFATSSLRISLLGDQPVISVLRDDFRRLHKFGTHMLDRTRLLATTSSIQLPPPGAGFYLRSVDESFEIAGGLVVVGTRFDGLNFEVLRNTASGVTTERPIALRGQCERIVHAFSVQGDPVIGLVDVDRFSQGIRFVRLSRR
jgi:hypothetical protein